MIVPSYTDERKLKELIDDWPGVKRKAKKLSEKLLAKMPKSRIGHEKDKVWNMRVRFRSKNGNNWVVSANCMDGAKDWWSVCYVEVENDHGTKSYYFLRGLNTKITYYVEIIPHAIRRIRERWLNLNQEYICADMDVHEIMEHGLYTRHDCWVFYMAGKVRKDGHFHAFTDGDGNTPGVVVGKNIMFYARRTPLGNFIFKTYIVPDAEPGTKKWEFTAMMLALWRFGNRRLFHYTEDESVKMLGSLWKMFPSMSRHLDCIHERFIPMFP